MNASVLCLVSVLTAPPAGQAPPSIYTPSPQFERVIRAQSPEMFYQTPPVYTQAPTFAPTQPGVPIQQGVPFQPGVPTPSGAPFPSGVPYQPGVPMQTGPTIVAPDGGGIPVGPPVVTPVPEYSPVLPPSQSFGPMNVDPFLGGSAVVPLTEYADPPGLLPVSHSLTGLHPYRFGITHRLDFGYLPEENTDRDPSMSQLGDMGIFEFDYESEYTSPIFDRSVFSYTFQYGLRSWDGPTNATPPVPPFFNSIDVPGDVHKIGADFELTTPVDNPFIFQAGFNPSINSDFESDLTERAWNLDARGVVFQRVSPRTTLVGGVLYWDRVDDVLLPYAGVIRKPSPNREYQIVFPYPRISFRVGDSGGVEKWAYVRGEYHVDAFQIDRQPLGGAGSYREQIEIRDWRVLGGLRTINPYGVSAFIEAGAVFGREVEFLEGTPAFDIDSGFIARAGLHF